MSLPEIRRFDDYRKRRRPEFLRHFWQACLRVWWCWEDRTARWEEYVRLIVLVCVLVALAVFAIIVFGYLLRGYP